VTFARRARDSKLNRFQHVPARAAGDAPIPLILQEKPTCKDGWCWSLVVMPAADAFAHGPIASNPCTVDAVPTHTESVLHRESTGSLGIAVPFV